VGKHGSCPLSRSGGKKKGETDRQAEIAKAGLL